MDNKKQSGKTGLITALAAVSAAAVTALLITVIALLGNENGAVPDTAVPETTSTSFSVTTTEKALTIISEMPAIILTDDDITVTSAVSTAAETTAETTTTSAVSVSTEETTADTTTAAPESETTTAAAQQTDISAEDIASETVISETAAADTAVSSGTYDREYFSNDLFIGDSIYTGLYLYDYFPQRQVFAKVGLNPQSARTAEINGSTAAGTASAMQPAHIFIMLGTNGLAYMSASGMADNMKAFAAELKAASPDSEVYIVSIPPVTYEHELAGQETMAMVTKYNALLESAAPECGAVYLDLCSQLKNESGYFSSRFAEADGLHFLGAAYKQMLIYFQNITSGVN